ncbi:MAG: heme lyase NrfEFG subunit NrfE, partial [Pseudomonadales bacterium 32-61-5]
MIPELGHLAMILALCLAVVQGTLPLIGAWRGDHQWMSLAQPAAWGQFAFLGFSFFCLTYAFMVDDFSVAYVANNSNSALPWYYKFSAVWGAHEGSLLLWAFILAGWTFAVAIFSRQLPEDMLARVLGIMGLISIGFLLFLIVTSNPFERYLPQAPMDGRDLNPLLQDFGLIVHPPMLYMGYVGFSVAFSFAIAALLGGRLDAAWARAFLGAGIALGSWWAYYELGWGGWWFWDPVENASFMPWLAGTALIHSLAVTEKRGVFKSWTVLLAIAAFSLSLLGAFLVRSGVLTSVHAFATDPERGVFLLAFLLLVVGGSLTLFALRAPVVKSRIGFGLWSRETLLLVNNLLLVVATAMILLGTLYPLLLDALSDTKLSVGPPYFNAMFLPLVAAMMLALGVGILVRWKDTPVKWLLSMLIPVLITSAVLGGLGS